MFGKNYGLEIICYQQTTLVVTVLLVLLVVSSLTTVRVHLVSALY